MLIKKKVFLITALDLRGKSYVIYKIYLINSQFNIKIFQFCEISLLKINKVLILVSNKY